MKFITIIPLTVWVYAALLFLAYIAFGVPGVVIGTVICVLLTR